MELEGFPQRLQCAGNFIHGEEWLVSASCAFENVEDSRIDREKREQRIVRVILTCALFDTASG